MNPQELFRILRRDALDIYSEDDLKQKLESGRPLTVKLGADPSRPDLHLGHSVVLRKLKLLQDAGHNIVFIIGDFTGMIGDPSGRSKTRPPLSFEETRVNGRSYMEQVSKILDPEKTTVRYNSEWLQQMGFDAVLKLCGKTTLARILERDDFTKRYATNQAIGLHELMYPLMQAYDSVELGADIEVGGSDQTFNLLMGRNIQRDYNQTPQTVMTFPLLPGLDGVEKMSKSLDNYIGVDEDPSLTFEKCMRVPDSVLRDYFRLTTDIGEDIFDPLLKRDIREAHLTYAHEIVSLYHGTEAALQGKKRYHEVAGGGVPDELPAIELPSGDYALFKLTAESGLCATSSEARRLIQEGGLSVDGVKKNDPMETISPTPGTSLLLKRGKNRFMKVSFL